MTFTISSTIACSEKPGDTFIVMVTARSRLWRVIFDVARPLPILMTSDSGTWPSVCDGTLIRDSADGSLRNRSAARRNTGY